MKIAIIGYGAATIGFLYRLLNQLNINNSLEIDIYDQNDISKAGGLGGLAYDGKLVTGLYAGSDLFISLDVQLELLKFFLENSLSSKKLLSEVLVLYYSTRSPINLCVDYAKAFYDNELYLVPQHTLHLGTDQLRQTNDNILQGFRLIIKLKKLNITFNFNQVVESYNILTFDLEHTYDTVIFATGRYGTSLLLMFKKYPEYILSNNKVDIGIRLLLPTNLPNISILNKLLYEWKVKYKTKNNMFVRTFCHNPDGFVVTLNVDVLGLKVAIVNGHSKKDQKSNNTNLAILVTQSFTEPFNDSVLYGKIIAQSANLLAGSNQKVILQTLGDFKNKKRTKKLFRVRPTLPLDKYILGDLTYVLPAKTYEAIVLFIDKLGLVIPLINSYDNLIYGVLVKFYGMKMNNGSRYKWMGDCSGRSRSIISAAATGYLVALEIIKDMVNESTNSGR